MGERKTVILSDSTCDLSAEIVKARNIKISPLTVVFGDEKHLDGVDVTPDDVYDYYKKTKSLAKTTATNMAEHEDFITENVPEGKEAVYFNISSEMSTTFNNARLAAEDMDNVHVIDSRNLSTGIGLLVLHACDLADEGKSAKEIYDEINELTAYVDASFVVETLEYLHKGGRCSSIAALGANLLKLRPMIQVKDGKMGVAKKYRGKMSEVFKQYVDEKLNDENKFIGKRIFITHSGNCDEIALELKDMVLKAYPDKEVLITRAGCTVSCHCGPGTLGVLGIRENKI
ncbi:MAG: DegV family protein [Clostridia bacterium]|nr:DegV family protein [Clostridia bacterium]